MTEVGLEPPDEIQWDGRIHRFKPDGDRKRNGWYLAYPDEPRTIVYGTWKAPDERHVWTEARTNGRTTLTAAQRRQLDEARKAREAAEARRRARNATRLARVWERAPSCDNHPYLEGKRVRAIGLRSLGRRLLVPMRNAEREIVGLQLIHPDGFKRYAKGSQPGGAYHGLGAPGQAVYVCEGYATAATVHAVTGEAAAVAFSAGNLEVVARLLRDKLPKAAIVVCADNDQWSEITVDGGRKVTNPGVYYAERAAEAIDGSVRVPQFADTDGKPTDFNDLATREGEAVVRGQIQPSAAIEDDPEPPVDACEPEHERSGYPFRALGYDQSCYYFLPANKLQVTPLSGNGMTNRSSLLMLAPLSWWEHEFPTKGGADWTAAADACIRWCEQAGTFDPRMVRGRGAWFDHGRSVLHLGQHLRVDGEKVALMDHRTDYVYESRPRLEINGDTGPATADEGRRLREITSMLRWERPADGLLFAGWCYLAPICGALSWRPHIWITGRRGSGKSFIINNIVSDILGPTTISVQSNSTEAGIRQRIGQDARPVLFDEIETEKRADRHRVQSIVELARQASSEGSAEIAKGTTSGTALSFRVRSMFCFGSINVTISQAADTSRFTVLGLHSTLKGRAGTEQFETLKASIAETITPTYCASLRARAYRDIPTIRANVSVFARAAAEHLGDQRAGDQYGTLLAGAYGLSRDGEVTLDDARDIVAKLDWTETVDDSGITDEETLLAEILSSIIKVDVERGTHERTVAELIGIVTHTNDTEIAPMYARNALERCGLKATESTVHIAANHKWLRNQLADTAWGLGWTRVLSRIEGANSRDRQRFSGTSLRCTSIPIEQVFG